VARSRSGPEISAAGPSATAQASQRPISGGQPTAVEAPSPLLVPGRTDLNKRRHRSERKSRSDLSSPPLKTPPGAFRIVDETSRSSPFRQSETDGRSQSKAVTPAAASQTRSTTARFGRPLGRRRPRASASQLSNADCDEPETAGRQVVSRYEAAPIRTRSYIWAESGSQPRSSVSGREYCLSWMQL
jgi:hypothetical protein